MRVTCPNCGGDHPKWDCKLPAKKSATGERIGARAVHGFSGGDAVQLGIPAVSNKPVADTEPHLTAGPSAPDTGVAVNHAASGGPAEANGASKFDKKAWMRDYMREHRRGLRRRAGK